MPSPVCEFLLSLALKLCDMSTEDPGQRRWCCMVLGGEIPATLAIMCATSRVTRFEPSVCFQGELGFGFFKESSSMRIYFEDFVVDSLADLFSFVYKKTRR